MRTVALILLLFAAATGAVAQTYCSLVVKIVDPNGREVPEAAVSLSEENGRIVKAENQRGGVRFCDLGLLPVTITVGSPSCNQVTVRNVPLQWGSTKTIKIIYDAAPCLRDLPPVAACKILFRFSDDRGKWISGVVLDPPVSTADPSRSDDSGRILVRIAAGTELRAMTKRDGYAPEDLHLTCTRDLMIAERPLKLRPAGPH